MINAASFFTAMMSTLLGLTTSQQVLDKLLMTTEAGVIPNGQSVFISTVHHNDGVLDRGLLSLYLQRGAVPLFSHIEVHVSLFNKVS